MSATRHRNPATQPLRHRRVATPDEAVEHLRTVRDHLRHATSRLQAAGAAFGQGTLDAHGEATWLVCHVLHLPFEHQETYLDARICPSEARAIQNLLEARCATRQPLAYLTGEAWLRGWRFHADDRALVPRSLIVEALDEDQIAPLLPVRPETGLPRVDHLLDLCCGGGSIALIAAHHFEEAQITGADLSVDALDLARVNTALHVDEYGLDLARLTWRQGDLYASLTGDPDQPAEHKPGPFDLILCNPPYVNQSSMERLPTEFLSEPRSALAGGVDGMNLIERIIWGARPWLQPDGLLVIEIGHEAPHFIARYQHELAWHWITTSAGPHHVLAIEAGSLPD